ncbi:MAG TPA: hypothetical protein VIF14_18820 [Alphaproteobacteria bacterium]|jgi:hypothetical protein
MRRLLIAGGFLAAAIALAVSAQAAPLGGAELQARSAGGEFRGYGTTRRSQLEDVIWRLSPNGTVSSISLVRRGGRDTGQFIEYRDSGTWRVEGNRLCVAFDGVHRDFNGCYGVDGGGGDHVRLVGPLQFEGTLGH